VAGQDPDDIEHVQSPSLERLVSDDPRAVEVFVVTIRLPARGILERPPALATETEVPINPLSSVASPFASCSSSRPDVDGDPPSLVLSERLCYRASASLSGLDVGERVPLRASRKT
jgi:hypothetical protein